MSNRLVVAIEHHFYRCQGKVYTDIAFAYEYWREYLELFSEVEVVARVGEISEIPSHLRRADGQGVSFVDLPNYYGPWKFCKDFPLIIIRCYKAVKNSDHILVRTGNIAFCVTLCARLLRRDYAVEYVGDSLTAIKCARLSGHRILDLLFAWMIHFSNKVQAKRASCASYVSEYVKNIYPSRYPDREFVFSGVQLNKELVTSPRSKETIEASKPVIVSVGRLMAEKGHRILVEAAAKLQQLRKDDWQILIVGKGTEAEPLQKLISSLNLQDKVKLTGIVKWGPDLFNLLDRARLFVIPSLTEGMPRALIEAMARGLPAIGSKTGGIIELLEEEDLVQSGDPAELSRKIDEVLDDIQRLETMSKRNFEKAMQYRPELMIRRKIMFWKAIKNSSIKRKEAKV